MVKLILVCCVSILIGCTTPNVVTSQVTYDYIKAPSYPLTHKHQVMSVSVDDKTLKPPETKLELETLKLRYHDQEERAQIVVYVRFQPSFLVQRSPVSRQIIEYDKNNKGQVRYLMTNRGFIRTPYSIELVDTLAGELISQTQGAGNFSIDAPPKSTKVATKKALLNSFYQNLPNARQTLLDNIWQDLKTKHLQEVQVSLANMQFDLVSKHPYESAFESAFSLLKKNDKAAAKEALAIYNQAYKRYQAKADEESQNTLRFIDDGITAAAKIVNDPNPQRYNNKF